MSKFVLSGFSDEISPDFIEQLSEIKKMDIAYIEIRGVNGVNISDHTLEEIKEVKKQLDDNEIRVSAIGSRIGKIKIEDDFEPHFELFKYTVEIAKMLETKHIRMFSFFMDTSKADVYREEVMRRLKMMVDYVRDTDIVLLHENEKEIYGDVPERCMDIYNELGCDNFKLIFDPANFVQCGVETYPYAYEMTKDAVIYYHIKDALIKNGKVVPSGMGDGKIKEIINDLYKTGYHGFLSIEPHLGNFVGLNDLENEPNEHQMDGNGDAAKFRLAKDNLVKIINEVQNG